MNTKNLNGKEYPSLEHRNSHYGTIGKNVRITSPEAKKMFTARLRNECVNNIFEKDSHLVGKLTSAMLLNLLG